MSGHYSKFNLNTYRHTPYFEAQCPAGYPVDRVLLACRTFHALPPNLRRLASLSKQWLQKHNDGSGWYNDEIKQWYDDEGYELDPGTGERMTEDAIEESWASCYEPPDDEEQYRTMDIPVPTGGFADPDTWVKPPVPEEPDEDDGIPWEYLLHDIAGWGRDYVARDYGVELDGIDTDEGLARAIFTKLGRALPADPPRGKTIAQPLPAPPETPR